MWRTKSSWDEELPSTLAKRWSTFREDTSKITLLRIPRWINYCTSCRLELHVFADASRRAFAAAVYSRIIISSDHIVVNLLSAKTKLVPLKTLTKTKESVVRMTIPRLELRATLLAARLAQEQARALNVSLMDCYAWSDSQVVLQWLQSSDPLGNHFADNYVTHVHEVLPGVHWRYVSTQENPADLATRGLSAISLAQSERWWKGPTWMADPECSWPKGRIPSDDQPTTASPPTPRVIQSMATQTEPSFIDQFSSLKRLLVATARCRRTIQCRFRPDDDHRPLGSIRSDELRREFLTCVGLTQRRDFSEELQRLSQGQPVAISSTLSRLDPYLDDTQIMRVGGRLQHSLLSDEEKHPPILSGHNHLAQLVVDWAHERALHGGFHLTHAYAMRRAWIVGGRTLIKRQLRKCTVCLRTSQRPLQQLMAPLPAARVTPSRPFNRTGVDYAGPYHVLRSKGRGTASSKGYVAVFVCLATKAIHLELVGDLTTESFLGALSRFIGRRGRPAELWSERATTLPIFEAHTWNCVAYSGKLNLTGIESKGHLLKMVLPGTSSPLRPSLRRTVGGGG